MNATCIGGVIVVGEKDSEYLPSAEEIFAVIFERRSDLPVEADALRATGLKFSDQPAVPVLLLTSGTGQKHEPLLHCALAGSVGGQTVPAGKRGIFRADYVIVSDTWYPLPAGTGGAYSKLGALYGFTSDSITLGQYIGLLHGAGDFNIDDRATADLAAAHLAPRLNRNLPSGLAIEPYSYQATGIRWLSLLVSNGVGCILADEMGLGKTLQIIGTLLGEVAAGRSPNIVICPATLLENWRRELSRFAPSLRCLVHTGSRRTGRSSELRTPDVIISSYETVAGDISLFRTIQWNLVVLDEAQNIRNPEARRTLRCKELPRRAGVAVTGTPVENQLLDLWSISDFAVPGYLGTRQQFERDHDETQVSAAELEPLVSAIMLRRRVREVADDLPERIDVPVPLVLDPVSSAAYEEIREEAKQSSRAPSLTALVRLRMFCAHPWTAQKFKETLDPVACSPKLERCLEIIEEFKAAGEKVLIFTSFNETADIIEAEVGRRCGVPASQINGRVPVGERQLLVDAFASITGSAILVLNPKAAGTGLNITAANHVIHFNPEWNPAVEDQASARSHRRGQERPVTVHRLFYADTVEEVIYERMGRKRQLAETAVVGAAGTEDDLADVVEALQRSPKNRA